MGTDDSKSRARFGSSLRVRARYSTRPVSLSFSDLLRLRRFRRLRLLILALRTSIPHFVRCFGFADLRLHGDDVYFSLEDFGFGLADGAQAQAQCKDSHSKSCLKVALDFVSPKNVEECIPGIDLLSLNVMEGKICWDLYIEGLVINADGNLLDALGVAIKDSSSRKQLWTNSCQLEWLMPNRYTFYVRKDISGNYTMRSFYHEVVKLLNSNSCISPFKKVLHNV
ncbi:hypothetical protein Syun_026030 [Stephania yunnanensis]|uniref:Uncharacterized protein n=1 Tax=Stephania yunnanensis TaxID=152371 RepID=A0AAP0HWN5_9MAGN